MACGLGLLIGVAGCGYESHWPDTDGGPLGPLQLGRCVLAGGGQCHGYPTEELFSFEPLLVGSRLTAYIGPEGSITSVLLVRGEGFDPGDTMGTWDRADPSNPAVDVGVFDTGDERRRGFGHMRAPFTGSSAPYTSRQVPFIMEWVHLPPDHLGDHAVTVTGQVTDRNGVVLSASVDLTGVVLEE